MRTKRDVFLAEMAAVCPGSRSKLWSSQGPLFYMLRNRFYLGQVKFKGEILPGSQPPLLDQAVFDAVQARLTEQWLHRTTTRIRSQALLAGLLFDDAGHRMVSTYASKNRVRYGYYLSAPCNRGPADQRVGSVTRVLATAIETAIVRALASHGSIPGQPKPSTRTREAIEASLYPIE